MTDAVALTTAIGASADLVQFGGPLSLSEFLVQGGYEAMFYKPEEFQKFEKDTPDLDAKVILGISSYEGAFATNLRTGDGFS